MLINNTNGVRHGATAFQRLHVTVI